MCADEAKPVHLEYYELPFALFHRSLEHLGYSDDFSDARKDFWAVVPPGVYNPEKGRALVLQYIERLNARVASIISQHSIAYWLHIYKTCSVINRETERPATIGLVRAAICSATEAGIRRPNQVTQLPNTESGDSGYLNRS